MDMCVENSFKIRVVLLFKLLSDFYFIFCWCIMYKHLKNVFWRHLNQLIVLGFQHTNKHLS